MNVSQQLSPTTPQEREDSEALDALAAAEIQIARLGMMGAFRKGRPAVASLLRQAVAATAFKRGIEAEQRRIEQETHESNPLYGRHDLIEEALEPDGE